jgi:hypothetical protein
MSPDQIEDLIKRVERIERRLGISDPQEPEAFDHLYDPSKQPPRRGGKQHPPVRTPGAGNN